MFCASAASSRLCPCLGILKLRVAPSSVTVASQAAAESPAWALTARALARPGWPEANSSNLIWASLRPCPRNEAAMVSIIDGIEMFCLQREITSVTDLVHGVVIEEADDQDLAWLSPPT